MKNVQAEFMRELKYLLDKYDAEITTDDHWQGYSECGRDIRMTVEFSAWDVKDIDLGGCVDGE